ncbi:MAG: hypothetical protein LQ344_000123 [Seirophora lacunosa]|nr:MAG: hypothetical protein LQ344_000123 [Seirophora lacunosa]
MALPMSPAAEIDDNLDQFTDDLTVEDERILAEQRIVIGQSVAGKRKISAAFLSPPPSSRSVSSSSTVSTASVRVQSVSLVNATLDVPEHLESSATVEICGFTREAAHKIHARWTSRPNPQNNPDSIWDYMRADIILADPHDLLEPSDALKRMGLTQSLRDAIMDPLHEDIRETEKITFWALDSVSVNWKTVCHYHQTLKTAAVTLKSKKRKAQVQDLVQQGEPAGATATVQSALDTFSEFRNLPMAHVAVVDSPPVELADHITLWKAKAAVEMDEWINEDGFLSGPGLQTLPGGDFNSQDVAYYFTPEKATADKYWNYAQIRCPDSELWMIRVQVAKTFVDSLSTQEVWYGADWKEFVWSSRKRLNTAHKFSHLESSGLVKGDVCTKMSQYIMRIEAQQVQTSMNEGNLLFNDGVKATQWAIKGADKQKSFNQEIRGKIHIIITPPGQDI